MGDIHGFKRKVLKVINDFCGMYAYAGFSLAFEGAVAKIFPKISLSYSKKVADKLYIDILSDVIRKYNISFTSLVNCSDNCHNDGPIWVMWWQGMDCHIPKIVKACIASIKRHANGHEVIVIDGKNYSNYIDIPKSVQQRFDEGKMSITALSDYVRFRLLYE